MKKLQKALDYIRETQSKKIRSKLLHAITKSYKVDCESLSDVALAIEQLHTASLIMDDLPMFDDATMRRNVPCVHIEHGDKTAVLASQWLVFNCFKMIDNPAVSRELAIAGMKMCQGQSMEDDDIVDIPVYHILKTVSLFHAVCRIAAIVAGRNPSDWDTFAYILGELYQTWDDANDVDEDNDKYNLTKYYGDIHTHMSTIFIDLQDSIPDNVNDREPIIQFIESVRKVLIIKG